MTTAALKYKPFLRQHILDKHLEDLFYIESIITEQLKVFPNFEGIDFCDVNAGGIQVRGHHNQIKGYSFGNQPTINYDFSNLDEVIEQFVSMWEVSDTPKKVKEYQDFIRDGERWGWD
jgi:hypothetical protein